MEEFKKKKITLLITAILSVYSTVGHAETYVWNNNGTDYHDSNNWTETNADNGMTLIIGDTDQTIVTSIDNSDWLYPDGFYSNKFIVGHDGGDASIRFELDETVDYLWGVFFTSMLIGNGTGSVGEVTLLGSGKQISEPTYNGSHSGVLNSHMEVGINGGTGRFIVDGTGFNIGGMIAPDETRLYIGYGLDSVGEVSVLGGGKLSVGNANASDYYDNPAEFNETDIGVAETVIGYDGGTGALIVNGQNAAQDANSRAYLWSGTIVGSGDQSVGHIVVSNGGIINATGHSHDDDQIVEDLNLKDMAFVIGHNDGTGYVTVDGGTLNVASNLGHLEKNDDGTEDIWIESEAGDIKVGYSGHGVLVIKNQGVVNAGELYQFKVYDDQSGDDYIDHEIRNKQGLLSVGENAGSKGELYIGSVLGDTISEAGYLNVGKIQFGAGEGSVNFNHRNQDYVFDTAMESLVQGNGDVNVYNGVTIFNPLDANSNETANTYSGSTTLYGGKLRAGRENAFSANSFHDVKQHGSLELNDYNQTIDSMKNGGLVSLSGQNSLTDTVLTILGDYVGDNGFLKLDTVLGDDSSDTDRVIINGQASGKTYVIINNVGGLGAQTINGIEIIRTQGSTDDAFEKSGRIVAGVYDYDVVKSGDNWYLTSQLSPINPAIVPPDMLRPETGAYIANLAAANTLFVTRLHDRLGETQYTDYVTGETKVTSMWLRQEGGHNHSKTKSGQLKTDANRYVVQLGGDIAQWSSDGSDRFHLGAMAGYGYYHGSTQSKYTGYKAKSRIDGYALGLYSTWYANEEDKSGAYLDSWVQYAWFNNTVKGDLLEEEKYNSKGWLASLETGYSLKLGEGEQFSYWLQPKAQVTWMGVKADTHYETNGTKVTNHNDNLSVRLGVRGYLQTLDEANGNDHVYQPFVEANWIYNSRSFGVAMDDVSDYQAGARNIGELKVGLEAHLNQNVNLWASVGQQLGADSYRDTQATLGFKYSF